MKKIAYISIYFFCVFVLSFGFFYGTLNYIGFKISPFNAFSTSLAIAIALTIFRKEISGRDFLNEKTL